MIASRRLRTVPVLLLAALLSAACGHGQPGERRVPLIRDSLFTPDQQSILANHLTPFPEETQVSLVFIRGGTVEFHGVLRSRDSLHRVDNKDQVFEIGSITKVFTSTLLADLVVKEKLRLDDTINPYLPVKMNDGITFSFKALANHTSGLPRMPGNFTFVAMTNPDNPYKHYDEKKLLEYLENDVALAYPTGTRNEYSNLGVGLLAYLLQRVTGMPYQAMLDSVIFSPLNMRSTSTNREVLSNRLVRGRGIQGEEVSNWDLGSLAGAGAILSTAEDLSKFALAQFDPSQKALALTRIKTFDIGPNSAIGLGWHIQSNRDGSRWFWHNGGTGGYRSCMAIDVEKRNAVIVLSNVTAFHPKSAAIDQMSFALMQLLTE